MPNRRLGADRCPQEKGLDEPMSASRNPVCIAVRRVTFGILLICVMIACGSYAFALDPTLDVNQYAHTAWKIRDGFSKGFIGSMAQTPDGYLWLGTEFGLLRFDGVRNAPWSPPSGQQLPSTFIRSLFTARDGRLWIGTLKGLASWKDGKLTQYPDFAGVTIDAFVEDREGTLWAGGQSFPTARLCAIRNGSSKCYGEDGSLGRFVMSLYEDGKGFLWVAAEKGLLRWTPGSPTLYSLPDPISGGFDGLTENGNDALLIATLGGTKQLVAGKIEAFQPSATLPRPQAQTLLRDRNDGLWIGTMDRGLLHIHQGRIDVFRRSDGLSGDGIIRLFEDREGSIWVSTGEGLDRFREFVAATYSVGQGLSSGSVGSVLSANDGSVWLTTNRGLNRWNNGRVTIYHE